MNLSKLCEAKLFPLPSSVFRFPSFFFILLSLLAATAINVAVNYTSRDFMSALADKETSRFLHFGIRYLALLCAAVIPAVMITYLANRLGLKWRNQLTHHYLDSYLQNRAYYALQSASHIDNPDQRVCDDIRVFTQNSVSFISVFFFSISQVIAFTGVLWSISSTLVISVVVYATIGTFITLRFGKKLTGLNFNQDRREADFRYGMVHVRNHAESIASYRGEKHTSHEVKKRLLEVIRNSKQLIETTRNLSFVTSGYNYLIALVPALLVAPLYFSGKVEFGVVSQATSAFLSVLSGLSVIVNFFPTITQTCAAMQRLDEFHKQCLSQSDHTDDTIQYVEDNKFALDQVTIIIPQSKRILVQELSFTVHPGESLLITGKSGVGKSSLLRSIAGIWTQGKGRITRPPQEKILFLPQRPYLILGSLRQQLLYPQAAPTAGDQELHEVLERVNLSDLSGRVGGLDTEHQWEHFLSLGEQQRLAFARLLLMKPQYVLLDESTSALDEDNEELLYSHLKRDGITFISVGHRPTLFTHHKANVHLSPYVHF